MASDKDTIIKVTNAAVRFNMAIAALKRTAHTKTAHLD